MPTHPLLALARTLGNPVLGGDVATLIWEGETAPLLIDDLHKWDEAPQKLLRAGTELWSFSMPLPSDAYLEYAFIDPQTGDRFPDPLNPLRVKNGANYNNYFYMPQGKPTPLALIKKEVPHGTVTRHAVATDDYAVGAKRTVYLYQPPVDDPVPLLFVYDGPDYLQRAKLNVIVDNMIAEGRIRPFAMAFVQNGGAARTVEYSCSELNHRAADGLCPPGSQGESEPGTGKIGRLWSDGLFVGWFDGALHCPAVATGLPQGAQPVGRVHLSGLPICGGRPGILRPAIKYGYLDGCRAAGLAVEWQPADVRAAHGKELPGEIP